MVTGLVRRLRIDLQPLTHAICEFDEALVGDRRRRLRSRDRRNRRDRNGYSGKTQSNRSLQTHDYPQVVRTSISNL